MSTADHPHTDPGDGRAECDRCGKWVWPAIHSCKRVPVTPAALERHRARLAAESRIPAQCTRELDVEPTGAPDEDICLGDVDADSGRCRTCGTNYARLAAESTEVS